MERETLNLRNELRKKISGKRIKAFKSAVAKKVINKFCSRGAAMGKDRASDLTKALCRTISASCWGGKERIANFIRRLMMINFLVNKTLTRLRFVTQIMAQPETNWYKHISNWIKWKSCNHDFNSSQFSLDVVK